MAQASLVPYQLLLCGLIVSAILLALPLFRDQEDINAIPEFTYAQGYCARTAAIELMRVVPYAGSAFQNPVCGENEMVTLEPDLAPLQMPLTY